MTQELFASVLGVRRDEGMTDAAGKLQRPGLIRYRRAHISVSDRAALELHSCECCAVVKNEMSRLRGGFSETASLSQGRWGWGSADVSAQLVGQDGCA